MRRRRNRDRNWFRLRVFLILFAFSLGFVIICVRAYQLQVLQRDRLRRLAGQQHQQYVSLAPKRGVVYDRNRDELAISLEVDSVFAQPRKIADLHAVVQKLAPLLQMTPRELQARFTREAPFIWLKRQAPPGLAEQIQRLGVQGIGTLKESRRFYPYREMGSHVLGFAGVDAQGLEGVEREYDTYIRGEPTYLLTERDALGRSLFPQGLQVRGEVEGYDVVLTLDKTVQYIAEKELGRAVQEHRALGGTVIVMAPKTGEVLAIANAPGFNPNAPEGYTPARWRNRAVTDVFEPGSTFKLFLVAAALEEGVANPEDRFFAEQGAYRLGSKTIHDVHPHGWLTLQEIVQVSSNIGASKVGDKLGRERYYRYLRQFGFGQRMGVDLPGEAEGMLWPASQWSPLNLATISFGQGVSVTPIQLVTALSAIANGGYLMRPTVVRKIVDRGGHTVREFGPRIVRKVISRETSTKLAQIMTGVTKQGGTGKAAALQGFEVAGKTGTAQKINPGGKGYVRGRYIASFVGFVPAEAPKLSMIVMVDEPRGVAYGGVVAAPVFRAIAEQTLRYWGVQPTIPPVREARALPLPGPASRPGGEGEGTSPGSVGDLTLAAAESTGEPVPWVVQASASAHAQPRWTPDSPPVEPGGGFGQSKATEAAPTPEPMVMPNLVGQTARQALRAVQRLGLRVWVEGSGVVVAQSPRPGTPVRHGELSQVRLISPHAP
ncbi:MAG: PASTA domain-containing protein [Deltaproteobacteria bacterium]|nr:PASTA domain-containing protein [Deltaproteobacteria bacterium]